MSQNMEICGNPSWSTANWGVRAVNSQKHSSRSRTIPVKVLEVCCSSWMSEQGVLELEVFVGWLLIVSTRVWWPVVLHGNSVAFLSFCLGFCSQALRNIFTTHFRTAA
jgi:hypothetical protein